MAKPLTWNEADEIGILLSEAHPELDPLSVSFDNLQRFVSELDGFAGDHNKVEKDKLQAIQMAWHAEVLDRTQG
ncbi:MAG: Fe-S assembly protein IscX [Acidobacteria bacterium]|jgi:FeS assembly protein IscX|nr:MAG: Fe-S assembly protein IscX [Acidobacteriota bacterium]PYV91898.1 MAG: Fe-S assembly protein IscX [Acidobacteriota bacterium]